MMYVKQLPSEQQLSSFYQEYGRYKGYSRNRRLTWLECAFKSSQNPYLEILDRTGGIAGRTLLDLGCSTGEFLELVSYRRGIPTGVEIDQSARTEGRARGLDILEEIPSGQQFDVVCAFQVLEHLAAPSDLVATISRILTETGRALIAIPNAGEVTEAGPSWIGFRVDLEHVNYFTQAAVAHLLLRHGLYVEHFWQHRQPAVNRTDLRQPAPARDRLISILQGGLEATVRRLSPPPERFDEGTFVLSVLARKG